ncbi:type II toxin-antitoxin system VapC family toxin [Haloarcula nitratireducens]|uniref:PIN domain-containing protein n=1 Tax=Haloarcula nitratireducens TaxID=2487749 RepID=A0AAW4PIS0_9EURY|nr:PIN domain-containing protein [Halomicroarcula nitratireducens]MBX0297117.1 PIN domain-containing protein [Halomicroarcula nitratireducens]
MKLLDTTFLIHYWAGRESVADYLTAHDDQEFVTTTLNMKELAVGRAIQGQLSPAELRAKFEWTTIIPFDFDHAVVAGELEANLRQDDELNQDKINALTGDLLIAAVAKDLGATIVTQNTVGFEMLDSVRVESY